jgi:hypothetical protein
VSGRTVVTSSDRRTPRRRVVAIRWHERLEDARVFVLPNPSGRNANYSYAEMLAAFPDEAQTLLVETENLVLAATSIMWGAILLLPIGLVQAPSDLPGWKVIGSVAGRFAFQGGAVYCGTKFAVRAISDSTLVLGGYFTFLA